MALVNKKREYESLLLSAILLVNKIFQNLSSVRKGHHKCKIYGGNDRKKQRLPSIVLYAFRMLILTIMGCMYYYVYFKGRKTDSGRLNLNLLGVTKLGSINSVIQIYIFLIPKLAPFPSCFSHPALCMNLYYCITNNLSCKTEESKLFKSCALLEKNFEHTPNIFTFINICTAFNNM